MIFGLYQPIEVHAETESEEVHVHTWDQGTVTKGPTYTTAGTRTYTCTTCGETREEMVSKLYCTEHVWNEEVYTYLNYVIKRYTCQNCGWVKKETIGTLPCTNHIWDSGVVYKAATGDAEGEMLYRCIECGERRFEAIPKLTCTDHTWDAGKVTKKATYAAEGVRTYTCKNCGATRTEVIPKLTCTDHAWDAGKVTKKATYDAEGVRTYTCKNCGATRTEIIPKLTCTDHAWNAGKVTKEATHDAEGVRTYTCKNCGTTKTEVIPKLSCTDHAWDAGKVTKEATYASNGERTYTCKNCGTTRTEVIPMLSCTNHAWDAGKVTKAATYASNGERTYTCKNCGAKRTEVIPKLVCEDHAWDDGKVTKKATYNEPGEKIYTCKNCGAKRTEVIPKLTCTDHKYVLNSIRCNSEGVYVEDYTCTICHSTKQETHRHDLHWVVKREPTEENTGLEEYKCSACSYVAQTREIPRLECSHKSGNRTYETISRATCTKPEKVRVLCADCGKVLIAEQYVGEPDKNNHPASMIHYTELTPTYEYAGRRTKICDACGAKEVTVLPKLVCDSHGEKTFYECEYDKNRNLIRVSEKCSSCRCEIREVPKDEYLKLTCKHVDINNRHLEVEKEATATEWGIVNEICDTCHKIVKTYNIHPYEEFSVTLQNGSTVKVRGYFDYTAAREVADLTNKYRVSNGLNELNYNSGLQSASDRRAVESAVSFSHTRPDGTRWNTVTAQWSSGGENLAAGQNTADSAMLAWKNSEGHNRNLLYGRETGQTPFRGISVSCFHAFSYGQARTMTEIDVTTGRITQRELTAYEKQKQELIPNEYVYWAQNFTFR